MALKANLRQNKIIKLVKNRKVIKKKKSKILRIYKVISQTLTKRIKRRKRDLGTSVKG